MEISNFPFCAPTGLFPYSFFRHLRCPQCRQLASINFLNKRNARSVPKTYWPSVTWDRGPVWMNSEVSLLQDTAKVGELQLKRNAGSSLPLCFDCIVWAKSAIPYKDTHEKHSLFGHSVYSAHAFRSPAYWRRRSNGAIPRNLSTPSIWPPSYAPRTNTQC